LEIKSTADFVRMTRSALAGAGFVRREIDGTVYWSTPHPPSREAKVAFSPRARGEKVPQADEGCLVLIHGANDQAGTWFAIAPTLAKTHRVIVPDLPGHGESAPAAGPIPISLIVDRLTAILDGEARVTLVGNSLGGWIALLYALRYPTRVERLFLEASGGLSRPLATPLTARTREEALPILRAVHGPHYEPPEWVIDALIERANGSPMLRLTELLEHDVEPRLGEIRTPATLLWGADDGVLPLSYGEALRDALPNATLRVIEGAAHIPHLQQPQRVLECLTSIS
jgi:pimeloyl-ACP methyl ester carboxylesterase